MTFAIEPLASHHAKAAFACGVEPLDRYLREQAGQDMRRRTAACYVARDEVTGAIAGYYTLAAASVLLADLPQNLTKKLPRYPEVPVARIGRLAVDQNYRGSKLGAALLYDAIERARRSEIMVFGVIVDAKNDEAVTFYKHHGFIMLDAAKRLLLWPFGSAKPAKPNVR